MTSPSDTTASIIRISESSKISEEKDSAKRIVEIEEATNRYVIHRLSMALVPIFKRLGISPNTVSAMGAFAGLLAAWYYFSFHNPWLCLLGFAFMTSWHVFDGADGQLARLTGRVSQVGFVVDGVCDYLTFIFVYCAFGLALHEQHGLWIWVLILGAALSHAVQAAAFEMQRESYMAWSKEFVTTSVAERKASDSHQRTTSFLARMYRATQAPFRPIPQDVVDTLNTQSVHLGQQTVAEAYKTNFQRTVLTWSILSANNRTIAIFLFCLLWHPVAYLVYELIVLNLVLAGLVYKNRLSQLGFRRALSD